MSLSDPPSTTPEPTNIRHLISETFAIPELDITDQALTEIESYVTSKVTEELEYILNNASGGGSWRRVIAERIAELREK